MVDPEYKIYLFPLDIYHTTLCFIYLVGYSFLPYFLFLFCSWKVSFLPVFLFRDYYPARDSHFYDNAAVISVT